MYENSIYYRKLALGFGQPYSIRTRVRMARKLRKIRIIGLLAYEHRSTGTRIGRQRFYFGPLSVPVLLVVPVVDVVAAPSCFCPQLLRPDICLLLLPIDVDAPSRSCPLLLLAISHPPGPTIVAASSCCCMLLLHAAPARCFYLAW